MSTISTLWPVLDAQVRHWLLQNPGTMMLPRTYVNIVEVEAGQVLPLDAHGEHWLSLEDLEFLRNLRHEAPGSDTARPLPVEPAASSSLEDLPDPDPHVLALDQ